MNKEKIVKGAKLALSTIAGLGISILCSAFAGNVASVSKVGGIQKACMAIGGVVIGGMITQQAEKYIEAEVDNFVNKLDEVVTVINDASDGTKETT